MVLVSFAAGATQVAPQAKGEIARQREAGGVAYLSWEGQGWGASPSCWSGAVTLRPFAAGKDGQPGCA